MSRNVLNVPDVDEYVAGLGEGRSEHINKWLKTIFRRHLLQVHPAVLTVMDERELNSPWLDIFTSAFRALMDRIPRDDPDDDGDEEDEDDRPRRQLQPAKKEEPFSLRTVAGKVCYMVKVDQQPEWVQQAITNRDRLVFIDINRMPVSKHKHMVDWLTTLPDREIRYQLPDVAKEIALWDRRLANQKLMQSLSIGTEEVASAVIHDYEPEKLKIVKLITKAAYVAEGAVMKHCVGGSSYFGRPAVMIFSLRRVDAEEDAVPIATIEVTNKAVRQIKARFNEKPDAAYLELLNRWKAEQGFDQPVKKKAYARGDEDGDDDEDEDGDWDDDEDDDEGVPDDDNEI
jgi:hypothetical protein